MKTWCGKYTGGIWKNHLGWNVANFYSRHVPKILQVVNAHFHFFFTVSISVKVKDHLDNSPWNCGKTIYWMAFGLPGICIIIFEPKKRGDQVWEIQILSKPEIPREGKRWGSSPTAKGTHHWDGNFYVKDCSIMLKWYSLFWSLLVPVEVSFYIDRGWFTIRLFKCQHSSLLKLEYVLDLFSGLTAYSSCSSDLEPSRKAEQRTNKQVHGGTSWYTSMKKNIRNGGTG